MPHEVADRREKGDLCGQTHGHKRHQATDEKGRQEDDRELPTHTPVGLAAPKESQHGHDDERDQKNDL